MPPAARKPTLLDELDQTIDDLLKSIRNIPTPADRRNLAEAVERLTSARKEIATS